MNDLFVEGAIDMGLARWAEPWVPDLTIMTDFMQFSFNPTSAFIRISLFHERYFLV